MKSLFCLALLVASGCQFTSGADCERACGPRGLVKLCEPNKVECFPITFVPVPVAAPSASAADNGDRP